MELIIIQRRARVERSRRGRRAAAARGEWRSVPQLRAGHAALDPCQAAAGEPDNTSITDPAGRRGQGVRQQVKWEAVMGVGPGHVLARCCCQEVKCRVEICHPGPYSQERHGSF